MPRTRRHSSQPGPPSADPASVDLSRIPPGVRLAVRCALAARWEAQQPMSVARYAVARQFCLTVLKVEAIELEGKS